jgi:hypothetical protein
MVETAVGEFQPADHIGDDNKMVEPAKAEPAARYWRHKDAAKWLCKTIDGSIVEHNGYYPLVLPCIKAPYCWEEITSAEYEAADQPAPVARAPIEPLDEVVTEINRAVKKFPRWPTDPIHAAAVVAEECGELQKAVLEAVYEPHKGSRKNIRNEAIQTAAMCIRFLDSFDAYEWFHSIQHDQVARFNALEGGVQ